MAKAKIKLVLSENGTEVTREVDIITADFVRADIIRARQGWPRPEDAMNLQICLLAYCALLRTGQISKSITPDAFMETVVDGEFDPGVDEADKS